MSGTAARRRWNASTRATPTKPTMATGMWRMPFVALAAHTIVSVTPPASPVRSAVALA